MKTIKQSGFTLIELLVVIAIIGVLVTIAVIAINPVRLINDSRDSTVRADLQQMKAALQLYHNDCRSYPAAIPGADTQWDGTDDAAACSPDATIYMRQVPAAPDGSDYDYDQVGGGTGYTLQGPLNNPNDEDDNTLTKCGVSALQYAVCND